ncbi:ABC transporter permease [Seonamhaeicola marinus]|uniref:ABC transporter permease n=1 Tax=Seonamhaeicola marinus TaxID=1912246 RepID=A0A5D0HUX8_9FLAO|nr:ABC transporter permease [Seonamhaeicola marinus]TYA73947.1 ABC transporter permease [Seonamhaeicola marinus]
MELKPIDITNFLPHRIPFLMVDNVISISDDHVKTEFTIPENCIFLEEGLLNEAGLIENAAQTCSSIVGKSYFDEDDTKGEGNKLIGFISAIKKVTISELPAQGTTIETIANLVSRFDTDTYSISTLECKIILEGKQLLSGVMNLFIQELKKES